MVVQIFKSEKEMMHFYVRAKIANISIVSTYTEINKTILSILVKSSGKHLARTIFE